ncbi:MAG: PASTA domain-containing protein [Thermobifida fusca]|nr:PASTA domain-containing protein [Thermobifida fusca]
MPNVVGQKVDDARRLLESSDLEVTVVEEHHDEVPEGHVISQDPEAETTVGAGQSVTLTVSSGPELVEVPDIRGWKVDKARKELEERGFEVTVHQVIGNRVGDYNPKGEAPKGSTIEIWTSPFGRERDRDRGREDRLWIGLDWAGPRSPAAARPRGPPGRSSAAPATGWRGCGSRAPPRSRAGPR